MNGRFKEAQTGIIDLSADDPEAVEHMINCMSVHTATGAPADPADFYKLDYLPTRLPSLPSSPLASPISGQSFFSPRKPKKLNLAFVEDPVLATAAASTPLGFTSPHQSLPSPSIASPLSPGPYMTDFTAAMKSLPTPSAEDEFEQAWDARSTASAEDINPIEPQLLVHAKVYALAEKYQISALKALARRKFAAQVNHHYTSDEFPDAMAEVYESTVDSDRGLRDVVLATFRKHPEIAKRADVEEVVREMPGLAWELFTVGWGLPVCS